MATMIEFLLFICCPVCHNQHFIAVLTFQLCDQVLLCTVVSSMCTNIPAYFEKLVLNFVRGNANTLHNFTSWLRSL